MLTTKQAFNAFLSVSVVALMATYTLSIACVLIKRLSGQPLPPARWKLFGGNAAPGDTTGGLGKYGPFVNGCALLYSVWAFFWSFWPIGNDPTPATVSTDICLSVMKRADWCADELGSTDIWRCHDHRHRCVYHTCQKGVRWTSCKGTEAGR